jgi:hypothetical protein
MQWGSLEYVYVIFAIATAFGVLLQAGILLGFFIAFRKFQGKLEAILTGVTDHALPLIASSKVTLDELSPKLNTISANLVEVTDILKQESRTIKVSVDDVLEKTRAQTARVDSMVSGTLDGISQAGASIQHGIGVPLRQIHGIFNGLRAGFETLTSKPSSVPPIAPEDVPDAEVIVVVEEIVETAAAERLRV